MVTSLHYHKITLLIGERVNAACLPTPEIANGSFITIINLADFMIQLHLFGFNYSRDYQFPIKKICQRYDPYRIIWEVIWATVLIIICPEF